MTAEKIHQPKAVNLHSREKRICYPICENVKPAVLVKEGIDLHISLFPKSFGGRKCRGGFTASF